MSNYASASHSLTFNKEDLTDGYLGASLTMAGDLQQLDIDLLGNGCWSQLADQSATFTVTYRQGCKSLEKIDSWASGIQAVGANFNIPFQGLLQHEDPIQGQSFVGFNAAITNTGDRTWAEAVGERTVTWRITRCIQTNDPIDVLANVAKYVQTN
ncbi:hypothetical protein VPBG_00048 [Vibrio phage helene 12B3]|uniref:virion structural protein n=1 Tax=Vibrio phage helene 12B3 TaxID=573173 RepID=UPI0002C11434|nr:virion structural protein [Vibrio phage helene 12B3]YP_009222927.1 virion structural protein [Vibrio phage eugene 12A10]AGG57820.1 hypothetical protein VPBG_00048 [Vibrio phage helene 12B3]AGN51517.1 hypothetical protein VPLG_00078 [Vibrio phage eugene 12A10]